MQDAAGFPVASSSSLEPSDRLLIRWTVFLIGFGIVLRILRYAMDQPLWSDEAAVALNFVRKGYAGLLGPLDNFQVAPIGFLFSERFVYRLLGMSEYSLRLLPTLWGILAVPMFWVWARLLVPPRAVMFACGTLAIGAYSIRHGTELKPYAGDLFFALLLLIPATLYLQNRRDRWLILLTAVTPISLAMSFPAIFVACAIALAIAVSQPSWKFNDLWKPAAFACVLFASYWIFLQRVFDVQSPAISGVMTDYWQKDFPPANPIALLVWLIKAHTGNLFDYPMGAKSGGSTLNFLIFLIGLIAFSRKNGKPWIVLLLAPFALTFIAAVFRKYPYGGSIRVAQQMAPSILLLIGLGASSLVELFKTARSRIMAAHVSGAFCICFGIGTLLYSLAYPYHTLGDAQVRAEVQKTMPEIPPNATIAALEYPNDMAVGFQWYLLESQRKIIWNATDDRSWIRNPGPVWIIATEPVPDLITDLESQSGGAPNFQEVHPIQIDQFLHEGPDQWGVFAFPPKQNALITP